MPTNLNALIRYKTIDRCLQNQLRKHDIKMLIEACSEALAEYRGVYKGVGERTIRDDIRVMRSGILGFYAPIVFNDGHYSYSDPGYSIFNTTIGEKKLLTKILKILLAERGKIKHPDILDVLKKLSQITGYALPSVVTSEVYKKEATISEDEIAPILELRATEEEDFEMIPDKKRIRAYAKSTEEPYRIKRKAKYIRGPRTIVGKPIIEKPKKPRRFTGLFRRRVEILPVPYSWQSIFYLLEPRSTN